MKRKKSIGIIGAISLFAILGLILISLLSTNGDDFIDGEDIFNLEDEYIVYFWQENCRYCQEIEDDIDAFKEDGPLPIYIIDMTKSENRFLWYDWEAHHVENDRIIGYIEDDQRVFTEDPDSYLNNQDIQYDIVEEGNHVIAKHQTAFYNANPTELAELDIVVTPSLLYVGGSPQLAIGPEETVELLRALQ
ncbi:hypothetical protein GCM10012290_04450 [Halolactibacillus alkaliphilus]|uniref:Thioredoxin-like fold domain-containing protein n=1 Tax=Halolactibacillus alkaliphilus TaxID=442899 RepID=A0A511WYY3_9BACI|nr:hypothetical protein [Halolactibacillus alkaliphilus]GEN55921.1 hypothetical protein HAL01_03850 [Halolactibacillus alkaliphilus]GGN65590.1 hypothetical protein GCM10012290_04450 [Halolactibacillus alkaliphilus]SFO65868.1 hypothetical protein SAMN05720591_10332 [Halolactibacillus alkaliphilus]